MISKHGTENIDRIKEFLGVYIACIDALLAVGAGSHSIGEIKEEKALLPRSWHKSIQDWSGSPCISEWCSDHHP